MMTLAVSVPVHQIIANVQNTANAIETNTKDG